MVEENKVIEECGPTGCYCEDPENCVELQRYKKLIYCDDSQCLWNLPIKTSKQILPHKGYRPIGNDYQYNGICARGDVGLSYREMQSRDGNYKVTRCQVRSDRGISGHMDFAKLLQSDGTAQGGVIPDPVDPGTAFGSR